MTVYDLPLVNASLNATATVLLLVGVIRSSTGESKIIRGYDLSFIVSILFLTCYLIYHFNVLTYRSETLWFKPIYLVLLISMCSALHVLATISLRRGLRRDILAQEDRNYSYHLA